jgi:phage RecT family recombinase
MPPFMALRWSEVPHASWPGKEGNLPQAEAGFASQVLAANDYALGIAMKNKASVVNAVMNIAAIGISLNPARRQAYLVPRDGRICLDISYIGLMDLAMQSGAIQWAQCALVYEKDEFALDGLDKQPRHQFNPFAADRGALVGAYAIATRLKDGRKYRLVMDMAAINKRRDVAQTKAVWDKWPAEMAEKTVARSIFRVLPLADSDDAASERFDRLVTKEDEVDVTAERAQEAIRATAQAEPATSTGPRRPRGLDTVAAAGARSGPDDFDPSTGEVIDSTATVVESVPPPDERDNAPHF